MTATHRRTTLRTTSRSTEVPRPIDAVWAVVASGEAGPRWYVDAAPWRLRGAIDRLAGGAGRQWSPPGRPRLRAGDGVGFWIVQGCTFEADTGRLVLEAAVRAPGTVILQVTTTALSADLTRLGTEVRFEPRGLLGASYLLADLPAREVVMELAHRRLLADVAEMT